ncbi:sister chromatid cohesion C-terminus-domain-containing protein [Lasiosphaeria miniovina]|uniref:Sister chromatid cohesion protein n=1 Tax=Lasiosphaeria miniovina TaxID=1954250 RepID=A0AA40ALX0_9PEZI|nr:sister chromatid cohesion C-terminus-domain-containing protein [Lasiosphaeria miniovina]KAK0718262.1 sister chromatid cohesion C-terminus-domain-containing protein [Lasiosphaeria miniovina]
MMCGGREDKQLYSEDTIEQSLNLFKRVVDGIVIPISELRGSESTAELFKALSSNKKRIAPLFTDCQKLFSLMSTLISKIDTSDTVTNTLEFAASRLIFMETAHTEKDSVLDTQKFDSLRLVAMDMLSQIFLLNPAQRQGIFDEILTSLEKLPLGKRARTFKLVDGNSIQPVSALIMRLVQTSAGKVDDARGNKTTQSPDGKDEDGVGAPSGFSSIQFSIRDEEHAAAQHSTAIQELVAVASPLMDTARRNASYVVNFIVNRALKSTKSGDTPYRNLLDLFVEDFTSCLDNPDWPAAELLLRLLMAMMIKLVEGDKTGVPAKNMALELLGIMGAAISRLRGHVRKTASALDARDAGDLGMFLSDLAAAALELKSRPEHMIAWSGPYRATLEYLESRFSEDPHLSSAISYIISDWASKLCVGYDSLEDGFEERDQDLGRLAYRLREMINDRRWLANEFSFKVVSLGQARLSYSITLLRSQLCESFSMILNLLLGSMASDQPTVRSKSLKSINQVLETDPSILDGDSVVIQLILRCSNDSSTQVRDSALGLIGKCIGMRPVLEEKMTGTVVDRFIDTGPGVRKRAMKLAKDIYLRNNNKVVRSAIASGLLHRVQDPEESVRDLARQVIEEIWFSPFHNGENSAVSQISLAEHVALMVQTVKQGNITNVLDKVLQNLLAPESKTAQASLQVCTKLVASMFDLVDNLDSEDPSIPSGLDALRVLMIFAKADASLFTFEQLRLLKPHITSIKTSEDLAVSRAVVVIYRRVLPQLSSAHAQFLAEVRQALLPAVSSVARLLLDDIVACLWIISTLLESSQHLARLAVSSLMPMQKLRITSQSQHLDERSIRQFERYSLIIGMVGKHCDLDSEHEIFKSKFPKWSGTSVPQLMVNVVVPFAAQSQPLEVRKAALDSVGLVCQSWPRNYVSANVYTIFQQVFDEQAPTLEAMILRSFKEFLLTEEKRSEQASEAPTINGNKSEKKRELTVIGGTNYDDVASATTHRFLAQIIRVATSTQDDHAFLAVEVLASINRQGLVHPKETGVTFITLETSSNPRISELAFLEHKALHAKHETVVEREYVKAIQSAFAYQRDIAKDPRGATANPFAPKLQLMMEVLKISKSKNRQKFLEKLCAQIDFDVARLDIAEELPPHVQYSRFLVENVAFFEYITIGELHSIVSSMEKLVTSTGATVAQAIESEVFRVRVDNLDANPAVEGGETHAIPQQHSQPDVDIRRLRQFAAGSMVLLALWEARTYLRRLYNMGTSRREAKGKSQAKDLNKPPTKVQGVTGEKLWDEIATIMTALTSRDRMMETCKAFVELMTVDKEFLVQEDDDEMNGGAEDPATPGANDYDEDQADEPSTAGRGRKRKAGPGTGNGNTPGGRKKRARSSSQPRKRGRPRKQSNDAPDADGEFDEGDWM